MEQLNHQNSKSNTITLDKNQGKQRWLEEIEEHLLRAEEDIQNGRVRDLQEVWEEWKMKYDL